jgi:hypothetical protein
VLCKGFTGEGLDNLPLFVDDAIKLEREASDLARIYDLFIPWVPIQDIYSGLPVAALGSCRVRKLAGGAVISSNTNMLISPSTCLMFSGLWLLVNCAGYSWCCGARRPI